MRKLLRRPSPAMLVAVAGVVVAMSGEAVADGVRAVASVVGKDQVTSRSVKDGSLLLRDIKRSERARLKGKRGPRGPQGAPGTPALDKVFRKGLTFRIAFAERPNARARRRTRATCPSRDTRRDAAMTFR